MEATQPQTIRYKLLECLGQGLNSRVFKALREDSGLNISQPVAIKILNSENLVDIWKKEFQSLSKVSSPHCVSVLGFDWIERQPALVLELIEGLNLAELTQHVELREEEIAEIAAQVRQGLEDLSREGLTHGDLSLNNVIVSEQGRVVLLDFGLANFSDSQIQTTVEFASPDVLKGAKPTFQTDVYALQKIVDHLLRVNNKHSAVCISNLSSNLTIRNQLAKKVVDAQKKRMATLQTAVIERPKKCSRSTRFLRIVALFTLITCGLSLRGEAWPDVRPSHLTIRSDRWIAVKINGQNMGYAPFEARAVTDGKMEIEYQHSRGAGHRTLTIRKGQHIVLGNAFFGLKE